MILEKKLSASHHNQCIPQINAIVLALHLLHLKINQIKKCQKKNNGIYLFNYKNGSIFTNHFLLREKGGTSFDSRIGDLPQGKICAGELKLKTRTHTQRRPENELINCIIFGTPPLGNWFSRAVNTASKKN